MDWTAFIIAAVLVACFMAGGYWLATVIWYWTRVGWRWARRNPPKGRFW